MELSVRELAGLIKPHQWSQASPWSWCARRRGRGPRGLCRQLTPKKEHETSERGASPDDELTTTGEK